MQSNLEGKTVLITDGNGNLGRATALAFAAEGANLIVAGASGGESLDQTAHEAEAVGVRVLTSRLDLADQGQIRRQVQQSLTEFGHLDVIINNARSAPALLSLEDLSFELWKARIGEQVTGTVMLCQEVLPGMIERHWGRIISYIGLAAFQGTDAPSSATELGLVGLTRGIAREYGKYNITANCLAPGGIDTGEEGSPFSADIDNSSPLPRSGRPEEAAFLAVSLASEGSSYVTGQCLLANGGRYFL